MSPAETSRLWTVMVTYTMTSIRRMITAVNTVEERLVSKYFDPYSITFTFWALAFVFLYLGLQKVVPHRSTADVPLATIGGIIGVSYIPFVTFVGIWQIVIGILFVLRRLRLCAWFFFTYQIFAFGTLVVLRKIVFQPPWITFFGIEIPWALGTYAAFILKNLIFAAIFFILTTQELDTAGNEPVNEASDDMSTGADDHWLLPSPLEGSNDEHTINVSRIQSFADKPRESLLEGTFSSIASRLFPRNYVWQYHVGELGKHVRVAGNRLTKFTHTVQNYLVQNFFRPYGVTILYRSYGFIWFYFGLQKPAPVYSPVRHPLSEFFPHFGIPLEAGMIFIGTFEMFLGLLFFFKEIRVAFWLFFGHQAVTLFTLFVIPFVAFQPPYISLFGARFPWALTEYGAFVIKNIVFIAGFSLLASIEIGNTAVKADRERDT